MQRATRMLEEASRILRNDNLQAAPPPERRPNANNVNASDVLRSARSMISASSGKRVFRRLNSSEIDLPLPPLQCMSIRKYNEHCLGVGEQGIMVCTSLCFAFVHDCRLLMSD